jgi:DNA-directed RNA polymerase I, II, and III subunit RPABC2
MEEVPIENDGATFEIIPVADFDLTKVHVRRTRPRMTRFERAKVLSMRAEQIANGTQPFVERIDGESPLEIAEREFAAGRIPFLIRRFIPNGNSTLAEDWKIQELEPCDRRLAHRAFASNNE